MRAIFLSATAALLFGTVPAAASVITMGTKYAEACYRAAEAQDTSPRALSACDKALEGAALTPHDVIGTHINRGILSMLAGDLKRANRDFDEALYHNPEEPEAWLNKGVAQFKGGDSQAALPMVEKALALGTRKPALAYFIRGLAHEDSGNIRAAYADLRQASTLDPQWKAPAIELARYQVRKR